MCSIPLCFLCILFVSGQKVPLSSVHSASPVSAFIMGVKGKLSKGTKMFMGERG